MLSVRSECQAFPGRYLRIFASGFLPQIFECRREAVGAMLCRYAAERPQGILQAFCQRDIALATQNNTGVLAP